MSYKSLAVLAVLNVSPYGTRLFQDRQDRQVKQLLAVLKNSTKH